MRFIGVPSLADVDDIQQFVDESDVGDIAHIPDLKRELWARFGVFQQRTYVLINDDGTTLTRGYGSLEADVQNLIAR